MRDDNIKEFGIWAEDRTVEWLKLRGYKIKDTNFKRKWGELDIVAEKEGTLVFIEVKASVDSRLGFEPEFRAGSIKMKKVFRAAQSYLTSKKYSQDTPWQMDIISLVVGKDRGEIKFKHFKNIDIS